MYLDKQRLKVQLYLNKQRLKGQLYLDKQRLKGQLYLDVDLALGLQCKGKPKCEIVFLALGLTVCTKLYKEKK